ncbi:hypothetical protein FOA52_004416 [Chlamydomonas sp. UWO 241]|nr:hypothetical protein FOA52_004416 [Chlamydomonas sp. UWO 241]
MRPFPCLPCLLPFLAAMAATAVQATGAAIDTEFACSVRVEAEDTGWKTDRWSLAAVNFYVSAPIGSAGMPPGWKFSTTNLNWVGAQRDLGSWNVALKSGPEDPDVTGTAYLDWQALVPGGQWINLGCVVASNAPGAFIPTEFSVEGAASPPPPTDKDASPPPPLATLPPPTSRPKPKLDPVRIYGSNRNAKRCLDVAWGVAESHMGDPAVRSNCLRMAFHDAGSYNTTTGEGGANGSIMCESDVTIYPANFGLTKCPDAITKIVADTRAAGCPLTVADAVQVAGAVAVSMAGGPRCGMWMGRPDKTDNAGACMPDDLSTLPSPCVNSTQAVDAFAAMGFSDPIKMLVVLNGAHTIGNSHIEICSKGIGNMTKKSTKFDHHFFQEVVYGTGNAGWFDSDRAFAAPDAPTLPLMTKFAESNSAFLRSWCEAYQELGLLGGVTVMAMTTMLADDTDSPATDPPHSDPTPLPTALGTSSGDTQDAAVMVVATMLADDTDSPTADPPTSGPTPRSAAPGMALGDPQDTTVTARVAAVSVATTSPSVYPSVYPPHSRPNCKVDVVFADPVHYPNGERRSTVDLYVSNTGDADIPVGWAYTLRNPSYVSVGTTDAWNMGSFRSHVDDGLAAPAMGTFAGTASQPWQGLSAGAVNTVNIGVTVSSRGSGGGEDKVMPAQVEVNGERCKFGRVRPQSSLDPEWGTPLA